jgi:hypothetical protein
VASWAARVELGRGARGGASVEHRGRLGEVMGRQAMPTCTYSAYGTFPPRSV